MNEWRNMWFLLRIPMRPQLSMELCLIYEWEGQHAPSHLSIRADTSAVSASSCMQKRVERTYFQMWTAQCCSRTGGLEHRGRLHVSRMKHVLALLVAVWQERAGWWAEIGKWPKWGRKMCMKEKILKCDFSCMLNIIFNPRPRYASKTSNQSCQTVHDALVFRHIRRENVYVHTCCTDDSRSNIWMSVLIFFI